MEKNTKKSKKAKKVFCGCGQELTKKEIEQNGWFGKNFCNDCL